MTIRRRLGGTAVAAAVALLVAAHVGSPDTIFEGAAGPYGIRVIVRPPGVVPGQADITVRILTGEGVRAVLVLPLRGGRETAEEPPPDSAVTVAGDARLFSAQLWLMEGGAYSIQVDVRGDAGSGRAIVPVNSIAWIWAWTKTPGFSSAGPVSVLVTVQSQMSRPSYDLPIASSRKSEGNSEAQSSSVSVRSAYV